MTDTHPTSNEASPEEVANYLAEKKVDTKAVPLGLENEVLRDLAGQPEGSTSRIDTPVSPTYEPDKVSQHKERENIWSLDVQGLPEVVVSVEDKEAYLRAVLYEKPVEWDIVMPMGKESFTCRAKSISTYENSLLFFMLRQDDEKKELAGTAHFITRMQEYSVTLQLMRFNDQIAECPLLVGEDRNLEEDAVYVRAIKAKKLAQMQGPRWAVIVTALRIFEHKLKICNDNVANRDFWIHAG